jgi:hypothetical protein
MYTGISCRMASPNVQGQWRCEALSRSFPWSEKLDLFGIGATHFLTKTLDRVRTEMSLRVVAYNLKRVMTILGPVMLMT